MDKKQCLSSDEEEEIERGESPCLLETWRHQQQIEMGLDTLSNPYRLSPKERKEPIVGDGNKIVFSEPDHKYWLVDDYGSYSELILTGSKVSMYLDSFEKTSPDFPFAQRLLQTHRVIEEDDLARKVSAAKFEPNVEMFRKILDYHLKHFPSSEDTRVLTYRERAARFQEYRTKLGLKKGEDMSHFISGSVYRKFEWYLLRGDASNLLPEDIRLVWRYLNGDCSLPIFDSERDKPISAEEKITGKNIKYHFFRAGAEKGTRLHSYIEARILGMTKEEAADAFPVPEPEDQFQVESFFENFDITQVEHVEYRVGSFRHKTCGSIDAMVQDPNVEGQVQVYDWKRVTNLFQKNLSKFERIGPYDYRLRSVRDVSPTSPLGKYMIQLTTYRKLLQLNGFKVSHLAYLVLFHPSMESYCRIEFDLSEVIPMIDGIFSIREKHVQEFFE